MNYEIRYAVRGTDMDQNEAEEFAEEHLDDLRDHELEDGESLELIEVVPRTEKELKEITAQLLAQAD